MFMSIPRIEFCYSWVYDNHWREFYPNCEGYPSSEKIEKNLLRIKTEWQKCGDEILKELEKISGLKWRDKTIPCYVVGKCIPFSSPLTIMVYGDYPLDYVADVLTHELVHRLLIQNETQTGNIWKYLFRKYKKEEFNTIIHIPVHAIHCHIFMKYFGEERLKREMEIMKDLPDYKRSWNIVMEEGAEKIMEEFRARIKV